MGSGRPNYRVPAYNTIWSRTHGHGTSFDGVNPEGNEVVVLYHGMVTPETIGDKYFPLAAHLASQGYCVVVPLDNAGSNLCQIAHADHWGKSVAAGVRDSYAKGRKVALVGHSLGGHAAIVAA